MSRLLAGDPRLWAWLTPQRDIWQDQPNPPLNNSPLPYYRAPLTLGEERRGSERRSVSFVPAVPLSHIFYFFIFQFFFLSIFFSFLFYTQTQSLCRSLSLSLFLSLPLTHTLSVCLSFDFLILLCSAQLQSGVVT